MANLRNPWDEEASTEEIPTYDLGDFSPQVVTENQPTPNYSTPGSQGSESGGSPITYQGGGDTGGRDYEAELKGKLGGLYTPGALEELKHRDYDQGWMDRIVAKENLRANNEPGSTYHENGKGGYLTGPVKPAASGTGGGFASSSGTSGSTGNLMFGGQNIRDVLGGLFPGGAFNNDVYTKRVSNASDTINRFKKSQLATDKAALAERGLLGSGPEQTAYGRLGENIAGIFGNAVTGIEADEAARADERMIRALELATGMTEEEARNAIAQYNAETGRIGTEGNLELGRGRLNLDTLLGNNQYTLGLGNLALGNLTAGNSYNLGRDTLANNAENQRIQHIIDLLGQGLSLEQIRAMGYI